MNELSDRQAVAYRYVKEFHAQHGYAPSFRDISQYMMISVGAVRQHLVAAKKKGWLAWDYRRGNSVRCIK